MKRGRIFLGVLVASGLAVAVACSFPDVTYLEGASSGLPDADRGDAGSLADAGDAVTVELDASLTTPIDAAGCETSTHRCDCDEDGWNRVDDAGCDGGNGRGGLGFDCDDAIRGINPGVVQQGDLKVDYITSAWPDASTYQRNGDWNCDGTVDQEPGSLVCPTYTFGVLTGCAVGETGFVAEPPCGGLGETAKCEGTQKTLGGWQACQATQVGTQVPRGCM